MALTVNQHDLTRRGTAFHEAGHHVIAYRFGLVTDGVTIKPNDERGTLGDSWSEGGLDDRAQVIVCLAGLAAQRMVAPDASVEVGAWGDYEQARELLERGAVDESLEILEVEAAALVAKDRAAIEAVAAALLEFETLPGDEGDRIVDCIDGGLDWRRNLREYREFIRACSLRRRLDADAANPT